MTMGSAEHWLLPLAVAWDLLLGEPPVRLHPVVGMGNVARAFERCAPAEGSERFTGRGSPDDIVLFKSNGLAAWDVAIGARAIELAAKKKVGKRL